MAVGLRKSRNATQVCVSVVFAAQLRAPDTARDDAVLRDGVERDEGGAGVGHGGLRGRRGVPAAKDGRAGW